VSHKLTVATAVFTIGPHGLGAEASSRPEGRRVVGRHFIGPFGDPDRYELVARRTANGGFELWRGVRDTGGMRVPVLVVIARTTAGSGLAHSGSAHADEVIGLRWIHRPHPVLVHDAFVGPLPHDWHAPTRSMTAAYEVLDASAEPALLQWMQRGAASRALSSRQAARGLVGAITAFLLLVSVVGALVLQSAMR
jgi:hypothetical protein